MKRVAVRDIRNNLFYVALLEKYNEGMWTIQFSWCNLKYAFIEELNISFFFLIYVIGVLNFYFNSIAHGVV